MGASRSRSGSLSACIPSLGIHGFFRWLKRILNGHFKYVPKLDAPTVCIYIYTVYTHIIYTIYTYSIYIYCILYIYIYTNMSGNFAKHVVLDGTIAPFEGLKSQ